MIDIYSSPDNTTDFFAYNPIYFDASSDEATIVRLIFDVYVNQTYRTSISRDPNLSTTAEFTADISNILESFLTPELDTSISGFIVVEASTSAIEYGIRAFEVLDNGTTFDTSWAEDGAGTAFVESSGYFAINGSVQRDETSADFNCLSTDDKFLTNRPDSAKILDDTDFQIGFYTTNSQAGVVVYEYDEFDLNVATATISAITYQYGKGWVTIDASSFDPTTAYIQVQVGSDPGGFNTNLSELKTYTLTSECNNDTVRLFWQNPLGGQDYYHFSGNREIRRRSNRTTYEKQLPRNYTDLDRGDEVLNVNSNETYRVWTETINQDVMEWLSEIGRSQSVYWLDGTTFRPVMVTGATQVLRNDEDARTQFAVTFRLSSEEINQRG